MTKRKGLSKGRRFAIFARDAFTCRYCGRDSHVAALVVDHVIPVVQGGSGEDDNLVTSCFDCNAGKAGKTVEQSSLPEETRLRLAQERQEAIHAADMAEQGTLPQEAST